MATHNSPPPRKGPALDTKGLILFLLAFSALAMLYSTGLIKKWMLGIGGLVLLGMLLSNEQTIVDQFKELRNI